MMQPVHSKMPGEMLFSPKFGGGDRDTEPATEDSAQVIDKKPNTMMGGLLGNLLQKNPVVPNVTVKKSKTKVAVKSKKEQNNAAFGFF